MEKVRGKGGKTRKFPKCKICGKNVSTTKATLCKRHNLKLRILTTKREYRNLPRDELINMIKKDING